MLVETTNRKEFWAAREINVHLHKATVAKEKSDSIFHEQTFINIIKEDIIYVLDIGRLTILRKKRFFKCGVLRIWVFTILQNLLIESRTQEVHQSLMEHYKCESAKLFYWEVSFSSQEFFLPFGVTFKKIFKKVRESNSRWYLTAYNTDVFKYKLEHFEITSAKLLQEQFVIFSFSTLFF